MAAFDPIEFFGIGYSRGITTIQHTRTKSQSSISLSSVAPTPYAALLKSEPERPWLVHFHSRGSREPQSLHPFFADITPESSVYIPTASLDVAVFESPNVSVNSSWECNLDQPFSIRRYLGNHERHEMILLSLSVASQRPVSSFPDALNTSPSEEPRGVRKQSDALGFEKGTEPTPNDGPLYRYITDVQPHELLSLALEQKGHPPTQAQSPQQDTQKTESSISLSATLNVGERLEPDDDVALAAEVARRCRERRQQRAVGQPRLYKMPRKRRSESPPQGHRDKIARQR